PEEALRKQYSPGFNGAFGTTLYTPGRSLVNVNGSLAFSSVPEEEPNAFAFITAVSRLSFFASNLRRVNSFGVVVPPNEGGWPRSPTRVLSTDGTLQPRVPHVSCFSRHGYHDRR